MKNICVISSDAGGTYALVPVVRELQKHEVGITIYASGMAIPIWQMDSSWTLVPVDDTVCEEEAIDMLSRSKPEMVLAGAGAYNLMEHTFRQASAQMGIFCFSLVDGWFNFKARFQRERNGIITYSIPDRIGVMNEASRAEMVAEGFIADRIMVVGAPHIEETVSFVSTRSESWITDMFKRIGMTEGVPTFVFFSAPVVNDSQGAAPGSPDMGYTDATILVEIVSALKNACDHNHKRAQLIVKRHPSQVKEMIARQLSTALEKVGECPMLECRIIEGFTTKELISISDVVLGMTTTALYEAAYSNRNAVSVQIGRNLSFYPDRYFSNIPGVTSIYDTTLLTETFSAFLKYGDKEKLPLPGKSKVSSSAVLITEILLSSFPGKAN